MILGDNIFEDNFSSYVTEFKNGATIFVKEVNDPNRYGVAEINSQNQVISIEEKPDQPKSNLAVTGLYIYDNDVVKYAKSLNPSSRGEIEITDINNMYREEKLLTAAHIQGMWEDAGTFDSLLRANNLMADRAKKQNA